MKDPPSSTHSHAPQEPDEMEEEGIEAVASTEINNHADGNNNDNDNSNSNNSNTNLLSIRLTPSADGILDVTPVNSYNMDSPVVMQQPQQGEDVPATSTDPPDNDSNDDESDSEEGEEASGGGEDYQSTSEWDKALRTGKSNNTGDASDFFAGPSSAADPDADAQDDNNNDVNDNVNAPPHSSSVTPARRVRPPLSSSSHGASTLSSGASAQSSVSTRESYATTQTTSTNHSFTPHHPQVPPASSATSSSLSHLPPRPISSLQQSTIAGNRSTTGGSSMAGESSTLPPVQDLSSGILPDVLMTMRQKIESLTMFDSDMMKLASSSTQQYVDDDPLWQETRESLKRSSQQSISAAVLVSLAHKRYERRRLAAMEIEKVVRSLLPHELERVRAILLLLSDDYVRSTSEDARKGGVVALAACAIGMKKVKDTSDPLVQECRDLILASVVHACQDHSQRVRYYACENLCNIVKVIPNLAAQHFFILFEILRSLYADVSVDVRKGAEILDRKMKEIVVAAMNSGALTAESCIPVFARFVYIRNKPTKRLTLTWLQELSEKLIGTPILEYLHLFLGGIFDMIGDPTVAIRQSALAFLQSVLPRLLVLDNDTPMEEGGTTSVNFDKILQALVTTIENPNPFVRKVAMYWMSRIVKAHIGEATSEKSAEGNNGSSAASVSVRNSVPHVLPGILLSIGDTYDPSGGGASSHPHHHHHHNIKNSFLPDQTTRALAEQTNACLQEAVRRDGAAYVQHLEGFILALREELDSPGGVLGKNAPAMERTPYRMDVNHDGTGIESPGWFRGNNTDAKERGSETPKLCALHWIIVLYQSVVPDLLKADYAREFIFAIINQLVDDPPKIIVYKSLEVLAKITVPISGEEAKLSASSGSLSTKFSNPSWASPQGVDDSPQVPMNQKSIQYALEILGKGGKQLISRDREVFAALIQMHSANHELLADLASVISYMCKLQPSEFVMVSFAVELDRFVRKRQAEPKNNTTSSIDYAKDLKFVSSFVQHMSHVLLNAEEAKSVRDVLKDSVSSTGNTERDRQRCRIFHILLHSFSHNLGSVLSLCLWAGAFRTASLFLEQINPLDIDLQFLLEIDRLVELLERPLFRHINIRMLEHDTDQGSEGSGTMLFRALKYLLMILPQCTTYRVLGDRLNSITRFRQSTNLSLIAGNKKSSQRARANLSGATELFVNRVMQIRSMHCEATWQSIRAESLETPTVVSTSRSNLNPRSDRMNWMGYSLSSATTKDEGEMAGSISENGSLPVVPNSAPKEEERWKMYWSSMAN